jgi:HD superfamily phosphohydrolase YqeK
MSVVASIELPGWAMVTDKRRAHIARVTALLDGWATALALPADERRAWHDAGRLHDALRDAPDAQLRALAGETFGTGDVPIEILHGPAAATQLERDGDTRAELLAAIRYHTVGHAAWGRLGRALYMADFLEPGRKFARADRIFLSAQVPHDFDGVFRQVVRMRLEWSLREGLTLYPPTVELWNLVHA